MEVISQNKKHILNPTVTTIDETIVSEIEGQILSREKNTQIVINLENTETCVNDFFIMISRLKNFNISLVNVDSRILSTLYMMNFDKYVKIFENKLSLEENSNRLINRRFSLVR